MSNEDKLKQVKHDLTPRQEKFCEEYLIDRNPTQAAIRAGYSKKSSGRYGHVLMKNRYVLQKVESETKRISKEVNITIYQILHELYTIGFSKLSNILEIEDGGIKLKEGADINNCSGISYSKNKSGESISVKACDKISALRELAKLLGFYEQKTEDRPESREQNADAILESLRKFTEKAS